MLDQRTAIVLEAVDVLCERGYTVIERKELLDYFPESLRPDGDSLCHMLDHLVSQAYIDVRYSDLEQLCLCPLPKGRSYFEEREERRRNTEELYKRMLTIGLVSSFFGGLIGGIVGGLF